MRIMTVLLIVVALSFIAANAHAEREVRGTIGLYLNTGDGNDLSRAGVTKVGEAFELVVTIDTQNSTNGIVFQMTELNLLYPGVFKVSTWKFNGTDFGMGNNDIGEYAFVYGASCTEPGRSEILRVGYVDVNGNLPHDVLLYIDGIPDDKIHAPYLDGAPGFVDCDETYIYALAPEAWDDDSIDPTLIDGVVGTDGLLVLNPSQTVPVERESISMLKAKY